MTLTGDRDMDLLLTPTRDKHWRDDANCLTLDPNDMQPEVASPADVARAKRVCDGCTVKWECRNLVLTQDHPYGVWAGDWYGEPPADPTTTACQWCKEDTGSTAATYCGGTCRVAAFRARQAVSA